LIMSTKGTLSTAGGFSIAPKTVPAHVAATS
jgi:hypothetical protein